MGPLVLDQQTVWDNGDKVPASYLERLGAHISGGKALLHRFGVTGEEALLGTYNPSVGTTYSFPAKTVGSILDSTYTKIYFKNADIRIYQDIVGAGSTVAPVAGYSNRLRSNSIAFKANGTAYPRNAAFGGRDVVKGDKIKYRATIASVTHEITSYVEGFAAEKVTATIAAASAAAGNKGSQGLSHTFNQTAGALNHVEGTANVAAYDDLDGGVNRTYTIIFRVGGDAAEARYDVVSSDGKDDQTNQTPAAFSSATNIGTKGATVTFVLDNTNPVDSGVPTNKYVVGQTFQLVIAQAFTQPTATSAGTYTGTKSKTIIVTVTTGGPYSSSVAPKIQVSSSIGEGYIAPFVYPSAGSAVSVGDGVTISFNQTGLCKGDIYYIVVEPEKDGSMQTLIIKDNMNDTLATASDGDLEIYIPHTTLEIKNQRTESPPNFNWTATTSTVTLKSGITATASDGSMKDANGVTTYGPVVAGSAYVQYREWDQASLDVVSSLDDEDDVPSALGVVVPDNPLAYAVSKALKNSNGKKVYYTPVSDPSSTTAWDDMLTTLRYAIGPYALVPLTFNETVIDKFVDHCTEQSDAEDQAWRIVISAMDVLTTIPVVTKAKTSDLADLLLTVSDNPTVSGTQYTRVQCPAGNGNFVINGVRAGDTLRYVYETDAFGNTTYTEYTIASVVNDDELILDTGPAVPYAVARLGEIHRNLKKSEIVTDLKTRKAALVHQRSYVVVPDEVKDGTLTVDSYHFAAALAGALSAAAPHQPFHYTEVTGFSDVPKTSTYFGQAHLRDLADNGFIVADKADDGKIYVRKAVSTDVTSADTRELSYVRNLDAIYYVLLDKLAKFRGHSNNVASVRNQLTVEGNTSIAAIKYESSLAAELGSMIVAGSVVSTRQHTTLVDRAVIEISITRPYPLNVTEFQLVV